MKVFVEKLLHDLFRMVGISPLRQFVPKSENTCPEKMTVWTERNIYFLFRAYNIQIKKTIRGNDGQYI